MHEILPEIWKRLLISFKTRFDQVVFTRCRIVHWPMPFCLKAKTQLFCKNPLSMKHILLECPNLNASRKLFYEVCSLRDFSKILPEKIINLFIMLI